MKLILMLCAVALLAGCLVSPAEWAAADQLCKPNGGVKYLDLTLNFRADAICQNGATFTNVVERATPPKD